MFYFFGSFMLRVTKLFPVFAVSDLGASVDFYQNKLGFSVEWTWGDPATRAGVSLDGVEVHLDCAGSGAPPGPSVAYCHMEDVDSYYAACTERGVSFLLELGQRPWGMRDFRVVDPDGNRLGFGSQSS